MNEEAIDPNDLEKISKTADITLFDGCILEPYRERRKNPLLAQNLSCLNLENLDKYGRNLESISDSINKGLTTTTPEIILEIEEHLRWSSNKVESLYKKANPKEWKDQLKKIKLVEYEIRQRKFKESLDSIFHEQAPEGYMQLGALFFKIYDSIQRIVEKEKHKESKTFNGDVSLCTTALQKSIYEKKDTIILTNDMDIPSILNVFARYAYDNHQNYPLVVSTFDHHPIKVYTTLNGPLELCNETKSAERNRRGITSLNDIRKDSKFEKFARQSFRRLENILQRTKIPSEL